MICLDALIIYLDSFGLICNLIGTLLIVFYISKDPNEWVEDEEGQERGEKWYALYIKHPCLLRFGVVVLAIGFLFSFIDSLLK